MPNQLRRLARPGAQTLASGLLLSACAAVASAQNAGVRLLVDPSQPQPAAPLVSQSTDFTVAPSTLAFSGCAVSTSLVRLPLVAFCFDIFTGDRKSTRLNSSHVK